MRWLALMAVALLFAGCVAEQSEQSQSPSAQPSAGGAHSTPSFQPSAGAEALADDLGIDGMDSLDDIFDNMSLPDEIVTA